MFCRSAMTRLSRCPAYLSQATPITSVAGSSSQGQNGHRSEQESKWGRALRLGVAAGVASSAALVFCEDRMTLQAEGRSAAEQEVMNREDRIRHYGAMDKIFDYFSTYQHVDSKGKKTILMSVKDFYNSITPGSTITHGTGSGVYTIITDQEIGSAKLYEEESLPIQDSILNKIQLLGLLTFTDFSFLLNILSTPSRYMDVAFHAFDVSADGQCVAKEFVYVMAKVAGYKGDPEELLQDNKSGLITYIFGKDRSRVITREEFCRIQRELIRDVLWLEFTRYEPEKKGQRITELEFCRHLLYSANITSKKKTKMLSRVEKAFKKGEGITFDDFQNFYYVLFGGADLERAMFFLDIEKNGVTRDQFADIAKWVAHRGVSAHVVDVLFTLLDEDGDAHLSIQEFQPVLFQWRDSRGFQKASLQVSLGQLKI